MQRSARELKFHPASREREASGGFKDGDGPHSCLLSQEAIASGSRNKYGYTVTALWLCVQVVIYK